MEARKLLFKQFIKKVVTKGIIFIVVMVLVTAFAQAIAPIISNDIALGQLENSDELYVMMEMYNKMKVLVDLAYVVTVGAFVLSVGRDTYKFCKALDSTNSEQ